MKTITGFFFIVLFCFAAVSKLSDFENFQVQLAQSPLLGAYAGFVSYAVLVALLAVVVLLCLRRARTAGLAGSLLLMLLFAGYTAYVLFFAASTPCNCIGILPQLSWQQNFAAELAGAGLGIAGIYGSTAEKIKLQQESQRGRAL